MEKSFVKHEQNGNYSMQRKIFQDLGNKFTNKEALIFAYMGLLRFKNKVNCLKTVTGASKNHSSGKIFKN